MLYVLAIFFPPIACLACGKFSSFVVNTLLCMTVIGIPIAILHAWFVVRDQDAALRGHPPYTLIMEGRDRERSAYSRRRTRERDDA